MNLFFIRYLNRMKNTLSLLLIFIVTSCFSQIVIKGTVSEKNGALEGATVYLNNTMFGTTTDGKGNFELPVKKGIYELIVSYLGYKKIVYNLNTETYDQPLIFTLQEEENSLDEVIIKKTVYDQNWKNNLQVFKKEFLGRSEFSQDCEILNEEVLFFDFDGLQNRFETFARKPLKIKNNALGYLITYELESFLRDKNYITYLGYSRYQPLKGGKRKHKRWFKNRLKTYKGSANHFFKSLMNNELEKEGFVVEQFKRVYLKQKEVNKNKSRKFRDSIYKSYLTTKDILTRKPLELILNFNDNLLVIYSKEKEEIGYRKTGLLRPQMSTIIPIKRPIKIDKNGVLDNPLDLYYEGYWAFERFANTLPIDYVPNTESEKL